jgi:hypothetical protein
MSDDGDRNLWTCSQCGTTIDIGTDDLAGDEEVVKMRSTETREGAE